MTDDGQEDERQPEPEDDSAEDQESPFPRPTMDVIEGNDMSPREYT